MTEKYHRSNNLFGVGKYGMTREKTSEMYAVRSQYAR